MSVDEKNETNKRGRDSIEPVQAVGTAPKKARSRVHPIIIIPDWQPIAFTRKKTTDASTIWYQFILHNSESNYPVELFLFDPRSVSEFDLEDIMRWLKTTEQSGLALRQILNDEEPEYVTYPDKYHHLKSIGEWRPLVVDYSNDVHKLANDENAVKYSTCQTFYLDA